MEEISHRARGRRLALRPGFGYCIVCVSKALFHRGPRRPGGARVAVTASPALLAWIRGFAEEAVTDSVVAAFVRKVDDRVMEQIPTIATDPMLSEILHGSTRSQWRSFVTNLTSEHQFALPGPAADLARSLARRGTDLGVLLKVYRAAHHSVFAFFTEVTDTLDESAPPRDEALKYMWSRAEQWMNDSVESLIETFYEERQQLLEGALLRRTRLVEDILRGSPTDIDQASTELSHPLAQWQSAFIAWTANPDAADATDRVLHIANRVARELNAPRALTVMAGSRDWWFWVATPTRPELGSIADLEASLEKWQIRLSAGSPSRGVQGFRSGHAEAKAAQRVGLSAVTPRAVTEFSDVELLCLVADRPEMTRRMVLREVGGLCGTDKNLAQLRDTVLAYFSNSHNVEATAEQLFVHKNTVRYRLTRAEKILGHPLTDRTAKVELALRYIAAFGLPKP
ncbi:PucR family transcriptional regulator [Streptomyces sp. NPDC057651]|uniref:PucR family transcriptional regulator n=1 Tax=unclassified Streptomyces TaxID=2593676 RepID=UPI0036A338A9